MRDTWQEAIDRAIRNNVPRVSRILQRYPEVEQARQEVVRAKRESLPRLRELAKMAVERARDTGARAELVEDCQKMREIVRGIVGEGKTVVLSKSMVAYECGIREDLARGNDVWETDLGELLIQLSGEPPSHIIGPAIHMTKEEALKLVREKFKTAVGESHEDIVAVARAFLREKFLKADIGIGGANAVSASTGSVVQVENEGNIRLTASVPPVHIVMAGVEKVLPDLRTAMQEAIVQAAYAGLYPPTYVNLTSGPSSTGDIELKRVSPAHGPREFHLLLLDNGRFKALEDPEIGEALRCIRCGRCHFHCPVYRVMGSDWGTPPFTGPMGAMWSAIIYGDLKPAMYCAHSGGCKEVCPMEIDIPRVLAHLKSKFYEERKA